MSTTAQTVVSTPRSKMAALCESIELMLSDMEKLLPDCPMEYSLEPEEALVIKSVIEIARKAGQVKGGRMTWSHHSDWFVFRNTSLGISASMTGIRPTWAVKPAKPRLVPIYVPEEYVGAMRLALGGMIHEG
jgi:hypothetical protein